MIRTVQGFPVSIRPKVDEMLPIASSFRSIVKQNKSCFFFCFFFTLLKVESFLAPTPIHIKV